MVTLFTMYTEELNSLG